MAVFNEINEKGQLSDILQARLDMLGAAPAPSLMPEIAPCLTLENDRPEWGYLKGEARISRYVIVGAVPAQYSAMQLYVPGNRNVIAVVTSITTLTGGVYVARAQGIGAGVPGWAPYVTNAIDFRWPPQGSGALLESYQGAGLPLDNGDIALLTTNARTFTQPIVITPNTSLLIQPRVLNTAFDLNISWYERAPMPGELV